MATLKSSNAPQNAHEKRGQYTILNEPPVSNCQIQPAPKAIGWIAPAFALGEIETPGFPDFSPDFEGGKTNMTPTTKQLHILQHSLGLNQYGQGAEYRNRYVIGKDCDGYNELVAMVALGWMANCGSSQIAGGMDCFCVTEAGKQIVWKFSPEPPKISRSRRRYLEFLHADSGMSFKEWLKIPTQEKHRLGMIV